MIVRCNRRKLLCMLACLTVCVAGQPGSAQEDKPRLMLNTGGPVGGIRAVAFSPDSTELYAAGSGKVVNVWKVIPGDRAPSAIPADPLRWEIARGMRGRIYTLDVAKDSGTIVVGGFSARDSTGDLAVFDPDRRRIQSLLPRQRPDVPGPGPQPGHTQTVVGTALSPSGRQVASMSIDGEVRLWTNQGVNSTILQSAGPITDGRINSVAFLGEDRLVFPQRDARQPAAWRLAALSLAGGNAAPRVLAQPVFWYGIADIAVTPDQTQLAAADHLGEVTLFSAANLQAPRPLNRPRPQRGNQFLRTVSSLSFGPAGLLAVTTGADAAGVCWLEIWETTANPPRLVTEQSLGQGNIAYASAFSPDGRLLAVTRADRPAVMLTPVADAGATYDFSRTIELDGRGRAPGIVRFVGDEGYRIAIGPDDDPARLHFDLEQLEIRAEPIPPESRPAAASGWRVAPLTVAPTGEQEIQLFAPGATTPRCSLVLETPQQGTYLMHAWLTDENGQVYGIAVGTHRMDGIFLYDLPAGGRCRLMRYFRDHSDTISSLNVSHDGRYLVSSSHDQTIKIWSLAGLRGVNRLFSREDAWGATFGLQNGQLVVQSAIGPGIAVHRDLLVGDIITRAIYAGASGVETQVDPREILQAISSVPLWQTLRLSTIRNGQPRPQDIIVTPAWEPVASLFVDQTGEWAMWTSQGVYDASASGDELFGWHINTGRDQDPQYFRAEKFRRELEKPDVMRQLLISGSLQDALIAVAAGQPRAIGDIAGAIPQLQILSPQTGTHFANGATVDVSASVTYPAGTGPDDFRVRMFVNQLESPPAQVQQVNNQFLYTWSVPPAAARNQVLVVVEEISGAVDALFTDATVQVTADVEQGDMLLHVFALAAQNYDGKLKLDNCINDAKGIVDLLENHEGRRYRNGHIEILTDASDRNDVAKPAVEAKIAAFQAKLSDVAPDDILVVFVSGHGKAYGTDYFFLPSDTRLQDADEATVREIGIPWESLRSFASLRCRKLYLLDTCFSGNIAKAEKLTQRELKKAQVMVFAATSEDQEAKDSNPVRENNGLFTGFLLEGFSGKADGVDAYAPVNPKFHAEQDQQVNLKEVVSYVSENVRRTYYWQRPKYTPIQLLNFVDLPLFNVLQAQPAAGPQVPESPGSD